MSQAMRPDRPVVAVWRTDWLPRSETFIVDQSAALTRWRPVRIGLRRVSDGYPIVPDRAPFSDRPTSRVVHRLDQAAGYRFTFDGWLADQKVELIHAHFGPGAVRVLPIARRNRLPLVATFHGFDATSEPLEDDARGGRYRAGLAELFAYSSRIVAVSEFLASRLVELGAPKSKVVVHHIGIPTLRADVPRERERSGVTFVGRLRAQKGVSQLLDAMASLPDMLRSTRLRVVGAGELMNSLRDQAQRQELNAEFLGHLSPERVSEILDTAAVFCAPSITYDGATEGFGTVYLEAALHAVPVVAYASGGVVESVANGETGILVPESDTAALSKGLERLLSDGALARQMGAAGRKRVLQSFDITRQTAQLERIYDEVVAGFQ